MGHHDGFTVRGALKRLLLEYKYFTCKGWSLKEVGDFWDSVTDYDDINENTYSYYRRFTNSWELARNHLTKNNLLMLDIQARTGKGTEFWLNKGVIDKSYLVDFSDYLIGLSRERLKNNDNAEYIKILKYKLPFDDNVFDLVVCYETIEHIGDVDTFMNELSRVHFIKILF